MILEELRRWLITPVSIPSASERLQTGPFQSQDLPEMIAIVREAELACMRRLQELNRETRSAAQAAQPPASHPAQPSAPQTKPAEQWTQTVQLLATHRALMEHDTQIRWLQHVQRLLENKRHTS